MYAVLFTILLFTSILVKTVETDKLVKVSLKQYAHTVFLHYPDRSGASEGLFCGGSLILAQVVVTSAECLVKMHVKRWITAYFGSPRPNSARAKLAILWHKVHPKYNEDNVFYNLGVAFLGKSPPMGPYIEKIILLIVSMHNVRNNDNAVNRPNLPKVKKATTARASTIDARPR